MEKISIKVPEGYEVVVLNGTIEVRKKETNWLPKTWEEFCANNPIKEEEFFIDADCEIDKPCRELRDPLRDANILPNEEYAKAMIALCQLIQLRDCYNNGWQPDWKTFEAKYCICIEQNIVQLKMGYGISCLLAFKTQKIRDEFCINFRNLIEKAKILL